MNVATASAAADLPDPKHVARLLTLSRKNDYDAYSRFDWPAPDAIARAIRFAIAEPGDVDVNEIVVRPAKQEL